MGALIRDIGAEDLGWVLALNRAHEVALSPLNAAKLEALIANATYARAAEDGAFLIGFDHAADYDSENFLWHRARRDRFLYIDRIAVAATYRRHGLAAALYADLFAFAAGRGLESVVAEVNTEPPNPVSDAFHAGLGFKTVGEARLKAREKTVRYIERVLD